jgi:hypothetical protein
MLKLRKPIIIKNANHKAQQFCFKEGFIIYPELVDNKYKVVYQRGHKKQYYMKGQLFNKQQSFQAIWDLYNKIYEHLKL